MVESVSERRGNSCKRVNLRGSIRGKSPEQSGEKEGFRNRTYSDSVKRRVQEGAARWCRAEDAESLGGTERDGLNPSSTSHPTGENRDSLKRGKESSLRCSRKVREAMRRHGEKTEDRRIQGNNYDARQRVAPSPHDHESVLPSTCIVHKAKMSG